MAQVFFCTVRNELDITVISIGYRLASEYKISFDDFKIIIK